MEVKNIACKAIGTVEMQLGESEVENGFCEEEGTLGQLPW